MMLKLTVDNVGIEVEEGATILAAADKVGVYIPRLCSHPDLPVAEPASLAAWPEVFQGERRIESTSGNRWDGCGLCLVDVEGEADPVRACNTPATAGMKVTVDTDRLRRERQAGIGRIMAYHPHACLQCAQQKGCSQEPCSTNVDKKERCCSKFHDCELRRVAEYIGIPAETTRYRPPGIPLLDQEPFFTRDYNLCVGCLRCVRFCRDTVEVDALGFVMGGNGLPVVGSRFAALADSGCHLCLGCVEVCPTGALMPRFEHAKEDGERVPACRSACPAGIDIPRYIREIGCGEFARAEAVIRQSVPLPRVLGQVCFHPCEDACIRPGSGSEPLSICALKQAALEHAGEPLWKSRLTPEPPTGKKVAVIGAGPAGLSAAWFLRLKGHSVTLFDSAHSAGGWLQSGIPRYRLDPAALEADVNDIIALGVDLRLGVTIGREIEFEKLRADFDALLVAIGSRRSRKLPVPGCDLPGVEDGLALLGRIAEGDAAGCSLRGKTVVVIGGGNVAIDVARTARRLDPEVVYLYCLEERGEMPAHEWEIADAVAEGVQVRPGWGPTRITGGEKVEGVEFRRCVSVFDEKGNFAPSFDEDMRESISADRVLIAIGQETAVDFLNDTPGVETGGAGALAADANTMQIAPDGIFAAGETVLGPASVVDAVAQGRRAAGGIDRYLGGDGNTAFQLIDDRRVDRRLVGEDAFHFLPRRGRPRLEPGEAAATFDLINKSYTMEEAMAEAQRCLRCDLKYSLRANPAPPEAWLEFSADGLSAVPAIAGVYQLLDENKEVYAIQGVNNLSENLSRLLDESAKAKYFLFDEDPMFSKRESELIQVYLQKHGRMPPGEGDDDLDDLF